MRVIIRDFAYPTTDPRFNGIYPTEEIVEAAPEEIHDFEMEEEEEDEIDISLYKWLWSFQKADKSGLPRPKVGDVTASVIPNLVSQINSVEKREFTLIRVKTIFPFVKGTEFEMSLESADELFIIEMEKASKQPGERWSSIDELAEENTVKNIEVTIDPPASDFAAEISQFLKFNQNYGDGWVTALKLKIYGDFDKAIAKVLLKDIGLVPQNYIEPL